MSVGIGDHTPFAPVFTGTAQLLLYLLGGGIQRGVVLVCLHPRQAVGKRRRLYAYSWSDELPREADGRKAGGKRSLESGHIDGRIYVAPERQYHDGRRVGGHTYRVCCCKSN